MTEPRHPRTREAHASEQLCEDGGVELEEVPAACEPRRVSEQPQR